MPKQKYNPHMRAILKDAWSLTMKHKWWWILGFFALMVTSSFGYQIIAQGIASITEPFIWWERWQSWAQGITFSQFMSAQWGILQTNPESWFRAIAIWTAFLAIALGIISFCIYCITVLMSAAKLKQLNGIDSMILALREAKPSFMPAFWASALGLIAVNVYVLAFSLPVLLFGIDQGVGLTILLNVLFILFVVGAFVLTSLIMYTILFLVVEQEKLANAILLSWALFKRYWVVTLEMFVIQFLIGAAVVVVVSLLISLITIPVTIVGAILVSRQIFDLTVFLPQLTFAVLFIIAITGMSAYSVFNLYSWTFLFMRFKEIHPKSRIAAWLELKLLSQELK